MRKKHLFFLLILCGAQFYTAAQKSKPAVDSFAYYDELFSELESFIDSITAPRSFATVSVGATNGFFNYLSGTSTSLQNRKQVVFTPAVGYYHKSGLGIGLNGSALFEEKEINLYQVAATASYDYVQNRRFMTGVAYTHFFTKDSLPFYTSPLTNEAFVYFAYRKTFLKPSLSVSYGWGSRTSVEERQEKIKILRGKPLNSTTIIETTESISDLSVAASVKHDFYWLNVIFDKDHIRFSPQLTLLSGTQKFGMNQATNYNFFDKKTGTGLFQNTEQVSLSDESKFKPLSLSARLSTEFSKGKFFLQPQVLLDYYFPAAQNNFNTAFAINTGFIL